MEELMRIVNEDLSSEAMEESSEQEAPQPAIEHTYTISPTVAKVAAPKKNSPKAVCSVCEKQFATIWNMNKHIKNHHPGVDIVRKPRARNGCTRRLICPSCVESPVLGGAMANLHKHIIDVHPEVKLMFYRVTCINLSDFMKWKEFVESSTNVNFIRFYQKSIVNFSEGKKGWLYTCHRNGSYKEKCKESDSNRIRNIKHGGTIKIDKTCPAYMKVVTSSYDDNSEVVVTYQSVHIGHELKAKKFFPTRQERVYIAEQLTNGIPKEELLNLFEKSYPPNHRLRSVTRLDLWNICRDFNITQAPEVVEADRRLKTKKKKITWKKMYSDRKQQALNQAGNATTADNAVPEVGAEEENAVPEIGAEEYAVTTIITPDINAEEYARTINNVATMGGDEYAMTANRADDENLMMFVNAAANDYERLQMGQFAGSEMPSMDDTNVHYQVIESVTFDDSADSQNATVIEDTDDERSQRMKNEKALLISEFQSQIQNCVTDEQLNVWKELLYEVRRRSMIMQANRSST